MPRESSSSPSESGAPQHSTTDRGDSSRPSGAWRKVTSQLSRLPGVEQLRRLFGGSKDAAEQAPAGRRRRATRLTSTSDPDAPTRVSSSDPAQQEQLVLVAVNPHRAYVHWQLAESEVERTRERLRDFAPGFVLRTHDVTDVEFDGTNSRSRFDLSVDQIAGSHYLEFKEHAVTIFCELGLRSARGEFVALAHSNVLVLPRAVESSDETERSLRVNRSRSVLWQARQAPLGRSVVTSGVPVAEAAVDPDVAYVDWDAPPREASAQDVRTPLVFGLSSLSGVGLSSGELNGDRGGERSSTGAHGVPSSGSLASWSRQEEDRSAHHDGEIQADLVVYGRGVPKADLEIAGVRVPIKNVPVRADGTFELRVALPSSSLDDAKR